MKKILFLYSAYESYGIEMLSSFLKSAYTAEVELFQFSGLFDDSVTSWRGAAEFFLRHETGKLIRKIREFSPDLLAVSCVSNDFLKLAGITKEVKTRFPSLPVIFGGIHPTMSPDRVITESGIDFVCEGDGEPVFSGLCQGLAYSEIPNLWYRHNGRIIAPEKRETFDFSARPLLPDKTLVYHQAPYFKNSCTFQFSRGCLYQCSFCCHSRANRAPGPRFMYLTPEQAIFQLCELRDQHRIKRFLFDDDLFIFDREWSRIFLSLYSEKVGIPFYAVLHPRFTDREMVELIKSAGCFKLELAVQTMNESARKKWLHRAESNQEILRALYWVSQSGIPFNIQHMCGIPETTVEDDLAALRTYSRFSPSRIFCFCLTYYPGCSITKQAMESGVISSLRYQEIRDGQVSNFEHTGDLDTSGAEYAAAIRLISSVIPISPVLARFLSRGSRYRMLKPFLQLYRFLDMFNSIRSGELTVQTAVLRYAYYLFGIRAMRVLASFFERGSTPGDTK
ncbi:MAG: cobalamin-dependent protein [Candidatus Wallbacteria bacterium]|nr:cobalamin-dependent protein [Candidatus Wallbacteria bacterium]